MLRLIIDLAFGILLGSLMVYNFVKGNTDNGCLNGFLWLYWMIKGTIDARDVREK